MTCIMCQLLPVIMLQYTTMKMLSCIDNIIMAKQITALQFSVMLSYTSDCYCDTLFVTVNMFYVIGHDAASFDVVNLHAH